MVADSVIWIATFSFSCYLGKQKSGKNKLSASQKIGLLASYQVYLQKVILGCLFIRNSEDRYIG